MDSAVVAVTITAIPSALAAAAALITAINNKKLSFTRMEEDIADIKEDIKQCKNDMEATKEASFFALEAHVGNGANGDIKDAYDRLKNNIFRS